MSEVKEFRARIYLLRPEEGGRTLPVYSGYRPALRLKLDGDGDEGTYRDCVLTWEDREKVMPGGEGYSRIKLWFPELAQGVLRPSLAFELSEFSHVVARGSVIEVCNE